MHDVLSLDGIWKFYPAFGDIESNQRFMAPDFDSSSEADTAIKDWGWYEPDFEDAGWLDVPVPMSWNQAVPDLWSYEGHGWYRKTVFIPRDWDTKRITFESDGSNYYTTLYVNGVKAGTHEGGYTPFEIPIHSLLRPGEENTLAIAVDNIPKKDRCPGGQYDWWNHGGLYRNVRLRAKAHAYIENAQVITSFENDEAQVKIAIFTTHTDINSAPFQVRAMLTRAGEVVAQGNLSQSATDHKSVDKLTLTVPNPHRWTPDTPVLYTLTLVFSAQVNGEAVCDTWSHRLGLRSVEVREQQLLLNGEPFVIKGVNYYEDQQDSGRSPNPSAFRQDMQRLKDMGGNLIRCHFPLSPECYDICDEMGVFFFSELPLYQWGRPLVHAHAPEALDTAKAQLREIIAWQRNHPCVLLWSVSNENLCLPLENTEEQHKLVEMTVAGNTELVHLCHELDPTRPAVEVSNCWPGDRVFNATDICSVNVYQASSTPHIDSLPELTQRMHERFDILRQEHPEQPILVSEFGVWAVRGVKTDYFPGEYYQAECLRQYWEALVKEKNCIGGIIWSFADADVHRRFEWVQELRVAYGLFDVHRRPKAAVETLRALWRSVR